MKLENIIFKTKTASENDIRIHFQNCNNVFLPPLNDKINFIEYVKKVFNNAVTFEAWDDKELIGLIAAYFNSEGKFGFITNLSVLKEYSGAGIASKLLLMGIEYAKQNNLESIKLEVSNANTQAINFYKKHNFLKIGTKDNSIIMNCPLPKNIIT
jgi:ribosomal protein S18 acetylase RimI-like enzyme